MASFLQNTQGEQKTATVRRRNTHVGDTRTSVPKLDMCVAMDQSGSCEDQLPTQQQFVKSLVRKSYNANTSKATPVDAPIQPAPATTANDTENIDNPEVDALLSVQEDVLPRYSILGFASNVAVQSRPSSDLTQINAAIGRQETKGSTNTAEALRVGRKLLIDQGRHDAKKILVIISDGSPDNQDDAKQQADKCKAKNIIVIAVTVGMSSREQKKNMQALVSMPISKHLIQAETFDALPDVLNDLMSAVGAGGSIKMDGKFIFWNFFCIFANQCLNLIKTNSFSMFVFPLPYLTTVLPCPNSGTFESNEPTMVPIKFTNSTSTNSSSTLRVRLCDSLQIDESCLINIPVMKPGESTTIFVPHCWKIDDVLKTNEMFEYEMFDGTKLIKRSQWTLSFADFNAGISDFQLSDQIFHARVNNSPLAYTPVSR